MPRISDKLQDTIIYLYSSVENAEKSIPNGGTGFLVAVPFEKNPNSLHIYAVTNKHVIDEGKSTVIRFNTQKGETKILETDFYDWRIHPNGDDIAALYISNLDLKEIKCGWIDINDFITEQIIQEQDIGIGEDVFMIGRFINHDGKQTNLPSARFGNISMMPYEQVYHPNAGCVDSFLIETRSLSGNSGSPVFVYINPAIPRSNGSIMSLHPELQMWLLGIDWGHINIFANVLKADKTTPTEEKYVVKANSGQMAVSPAWKIMDLLQVKTFAEARKEIENLVASDSMEINILNSNQEILNQNSIESVLKNVSRRVYSNLNQKTIK